MHSRTTLSFLLLIFLLGTAAAADKKGSNAPADEGDVITPKVERREIKVPAITADNFEVGASVGLYSLEDFGVNPVANIFTYYHITESMFVGGTVGFTTANTETLDLFGVTDALQDDGVTYFNVLYGYNIFPGEVFWKSRRAWTSAAYFVGGLGATEVNAETNVTLILGGGLRMVLMKRLALHLDVRDHVFQRTISDLQKTTHNLEMTIGASYIF